MPRVKIVSTVCLLCLIFMVFSSIGNPQTTANDQSKAAQGDNPQTMRTLLNEVRQLRIAIQQSNLNAYRAQVIVERMRTQQQQVDRLTESLRQTRERAYEWKTEQSQFQDELKLIEARINRVANINERFNLEEQQERMKKRLEYFAREYARMQDQETQSSQQLNIEQAKLSEYNDQLDALQRELETPPSENQPAQGAKRP